MFLLLACGNDLRRDDGAGLALAARLEPMLAGAGEVERIAVQQWTPELALAIARPDVQAIVFIDTRVADSHDAGESHPRGGAAGADEVRVEALAGEQEAAATLGHHVDAVTLLAYARLWLEDREAPPAWLVTAPGFDFAHGEGLSDEVIVRLDRAFQAEGALSHFVTVLSALP